MSIEELRSKIAKIKSDLNAGIIGGQNIALIMGNAIARNAKRDMGRGISIHGSSFAPLRIRSGIPLNDTGQLKNSIMASATGTGAVVALTGSRNNMIGAVHNFGATIRAKNKPFLVFKGSNGQMIFTKSVTIPQREFFPKEGARRTMYAVRIGEKEIKDVVGNLTL